MRHTHRLFADRTSAATMRANQLRLYFSSLAYTLLQTLRRLGLKGTALAKAQCDTIRLKLLKWGFRALRSLIPVIAINESSDCDRPSERSDVRVWLVQFSFSGC